MSVAFPGIALVATGLVAAFVVASAGPASAASITLPAAQNGWLAYVPRIGTELQGGSYIRLAGATVRDHRSNSGGSYDTGTKPPSAVSRGFGQGGSFVGTDHRITCSKNPTTGFIICIRGR
jgi:hypothetical protein